MIPSLEDFAAEQAKNIHWLPIEVWLAARGILGETEQFLRTQKKPVATVHKYLVTHYGYADEWATEKPIRDLMNKVKRDRTNPA